MHVSSVSHIAIKNVLIFFPDFHHLIFVHGHVDFFRYWHSEKKIIPALLARRVCIHVRIHVCTLGVPVFHLALSNMAQRHVAFCERHVALHERHVALLECHVALHVRHVALLIFRQ